MYKLNTTDNNKCDICKHSKGNFFLNTEITPPSSYKLHRHIFNASQINNNKTQLKLLFYLLFFKKM